MLGYAFTISTLFQPIFASETQHATAGVVATDHALASACGAEVLQAGGNAVDAAVAAALCAGVVQPAGSGLGGGGFAVLSLDRTIATTLNFRETAPARIEQKDFLDDRGEPVASRSRRGGLAVAVPAEGVGLAALLARYGRLSPTAVARPAITLAREGFCVGEHLAGALARTDFPDVIEAFAGADGVAESGECVRRRALAGTIARWARSGGESLRRGRDARAIAAYVQAEGGKLTRDDLAAVEPISAEPIVSRFRDLTIVSMAPPSSGGLLLGQMLSVLDPVDLHTLGHGSAAYLHRLIETMNHAFAARTALGDPRFVPYDERDFLAPDVIRAIGADFDASRTFAPDHYGPLAGVKADHGTQHISAVDAEGNAVALTTTINTAFGSGLVVPRSGIILNDEMDDFAMAPDVPNAFGLVQGEANLVRPNAQPLSSMTPTIVLGPDGAVRYVIGASGGSTIITSVLQVLLDLVVFDLTPAEAVAAPRIHAQWLPNKVVVEPGFDQAVVDGLIALGHTVEVRPAFSAVQVIAVSESGAMAAASDPRKGGEPAFSQP